MAPGVVQGRNPGGGLGGEVPWRSELLEFFVSKIKPPYV